MTESASIYRVSRQFLVNLWQQAFYCAVGVVASWALFWELSQQLVPVSAISNPVSWLRSPRQTAAQLIPYQERELIRCLAGLVTVAAVLLGWLGDFLTCFFVRYEVQADKLSLCWGGWSRSIPWDIVQTVRERSHATTDLRSLIVTAKTLPPIQVRGLEQMPEFTETVRTRISRDTEWSPAPYCIDLTNRSANFVFGFLLPIPIHATWLAVFAGGLSVATIALIWAWIVVAIAVAVWYWRPLSRRYMCPVELEMVLAAVMLILSGALTMLGSSSSTLMPPWSQFLW